MDHFIATYIDDEHPNPIHHPKQIEILHDLMKAKGFVRGKDYELETGGSKRDDHTFGVSFSNKVLEHPEIKAHLRKINTNVDPQYGEKTLAKTKKALKESVETSTLVKAAIMKSLDESRGTKDWHIQAEHVRDIKGLLSKHKEIENHMKDPYFNTMHHFLVHGTKKQAEAVRNTIHAEHNGGAYASLKPYVDPEEDAHY